jgi:ankyrin repeat protein
VGASWINLQNEKGYTPLHLATEHAHVNCVKVLLSHNADKTIVDDRGRTAYDLAKRLGEQELMTVLIIETSLDDDFF